MSRALFEQGRVDDARRTADAAEALVAGSPLTSTRLPAMVQVARVRGDLAEIDARITEARRNGDVENELEARIAAAELDPRRAPALVRELASAASATSRAVLQTSIVDAPNAEGHPGRVTWGRHIEEAAATATTTVSSPTATATGGDAPESSMPEVGTAIGPYTLLTEIGRGGMGRVFLADDGKLARKVAIKFIALRGRAALSRFIDEARLTARCKHPNIVVIHDIAEQQGVPFMVLEHVAGPSLSTLLRAGALPPDQAVRIAWQVAEALAHAHAQGIIHRDLKPANILLDVDGKAKVVDFGIARSLDAPGGSDTSGTLHYMAPEQIAGKAIDARTDLFAFGVVLYQMLAGRRPFDAMADGALCAHMVDLELPMPSLAEARPDLPAALIGLVDRCLAKRVDDRVSSASELVVALERIAAPAAPPVRRPRWPVLVVVPALALAVGAGALVWRERVIFAPIAAAADGATSPRRAIAVLGFKNLSGDPDADWISTALAELLASDLGTGDVLRLIAAENVARVRRDLSLPEADTLAADTLAKVRTALGADYVVVGSYLATGGQVRLDVRLQDARTAETIAVLSATRDEAHLAELSLTSASQLRAALGTASPPPTIATHTVLPKSTESARTYAEGLVLLRQRECQEARNRFERVVAAESGFAPGHGALADALSCLGYDLAARSEAERAVELGKNLPEDEQLRQQARLYTFTGELKRAVELHRRRFAAHPDDIDVGLELIEVLGLSADFDELERTLGILRHLPGGDDLRIEAFAVTLLSRRGASDAALAEARRVRARAESQGARSIAAEMLLAESVAHDGRGDFRAARAAGNEALVQLAALADRERMAAALNTLGTIEGDAGALDAAERHYGRLLELLRELGTYHWRVNAYWNLTGVRYARGDLDGAARLVAEAHADYHAAQWTLSPALEHMWPGLIARARGDVAAARVQLSAMRDDGARRGSRYYVAMADWYLAVTLVEMDDLPGAKQHLDAAVTSGALDDSYFAHRDYTPLWLAAGKPAEAEANARAVLPDLHHSGQIGPEGLQTAYLARALEMQGEHDEALTTANAAEALIGNSEATSERLPAMMHVARVRRDLHALDALIAEAHRIGWVEYELEGRLAAAELDPRRAPALVRDAKKRGFANVARRAREVRR